MNHSWVSQKSGGLYHLEDEERFDVHGGKFTAFCGATGLFRSVRVDDGFLAFKKCETCLKFEVADQGKALQQGIDSLRVGDGGGSAKANPRGSSAAESLPVHPSGREGVSGAVEGHGEQIRASHIEQGQFLAANDGMDRIAKSCNKSENPASPADSQSFSGSTIENLTKSVIDAEMRAKHTRNFSVSSKRDPVYDANGRY